METKVVVFQSKGDFFFFLQETSFSSWFFACQMSHTFISERSGSLIVLSKLDYFTFPLTLIIRHGSNKRSP